MMIKLNLSFQIVKYMEYIDKMTAIIDTVHDKYKLIRLFRIYSP